MSNDGSRHNTGRVSTGHVILALFLALLPFWVGAVCLLVRR
jgi:hypothetical protein